MQLRSWYQRRPPPASSGPVAGAGSGGPDSLVKAPTATPAVPPHAFHRLTRGTLGQCFLCAGATRVCVVRHNRACQDSSLSCSLPTRDLSTTHAAFRASFCCPFCCPPCSQLMLPTDAATKTRPRPSKPPRLGLTWRCRLEAFLFRPVI